jgi:hypothetical protein
VASYQHGPPPWVDPGELEAERRRLFPSAFGRLWMNEWLAPDDAIADPDDVAAACVLDGPLAPEAGRTYVCALDIGTRNDRTAVAIGHAERTTAGTRVIVDRLQCWTPRPGRPVSLDEVRLWLVEMCRAYRAKLVYDPSQAYLLVEQIRKGGVRCSEFLFTASSVSRLATDLMQALRGRLLLLPSDEALRDEILSVRLRETSPNVLRLDHLSGRHDDRVIAVAMVVRDLVEHGGGIATLHVPRGRIPTMRPGSPLGRPAASLAGLPRWKREFVRRALARPSAVPESDDKTSAKA